MAIISNFGVSISNNPSRTQRWARLWQLKPGISAKGTLTARKNPTLEKNTREAYSYLIKNDIINDNNISSNNLLTFLTEKDGINCLRKGGFSLREGEEYSVENVANAVIGRLAEQGNENFESKYGEQHKEVVGALGYLVSGKMIEQKWNTVAENIGIDLSGAYFFNAIFKRGACFKGLNLTKATFEGKKTDLSYAIFRSANLTKTIFWEANLSFADFSYAMAIEADFSKTWLYRTGFSNAILIGANFSKAKIEEIDFFNADLHNANLFSTIKKTNFLLAKIDIGSKDLILNTDSANKNTGGIIWLEEKEALDFGGSYEVRMMSDRRFPVPKSFLPFLSKSKIFMVYSPSDDEPIKIYPETIWLAKYQQLSKQAKIEFIKFRYEGEIENKKRILIPLDLAKVSDFPQQSYCKLEINGHGDHIGIKKLPK